MRSNERNKRSAKTTKMLRLAEVGISPSLSLVYFEDQICCMNDNEAQITNLVQIKESLETNQK